MTRPRAVPGFIVLAWWACVAPVSAQSSAGLASERHALVALEDARPRTREEAAPLLKALDHREARVVRQAVRALGRLERPEFLPDITRLLGASDPGVRAEAANAAAQAAPADAGAAAVLSARLAVEREGAVIGALGDALGRLTYADVESRAAAERALTKVLADVAPPSPARDGAVLGLESLVRRARGTPFALAPETVRALGGIVFDVDRAPGMRDADTTRRAALLALNTASAADTRVLVLSGDRDAQIRRLAVAAAMGPVPQSLRAKLVDAGLADSSAWVRYEALRVHARHLAADDCQAEIAATRDGNRHVALLAIDQLATVCPSDPSVPGVLDALAARPDWLTSAHALVSLSRRAPAAARARLGAMVAHGVWQARTYAARAATQLSDDAALRTLAVDRESGVRAAAIDGLRQVAGHRADDVYRQSLGRRDYPVVIAAARALQGAPDRAAGVAALEQSLAALTAERRDTSRDARMAVLDRLAELGDATRADHLRPFLSDGDPRIAARAAAALTAWTGRPHEALTVRHEGLPVPAVAEFNALPDGIRVTMANGRTFEIRFFRDETPVSVWRIARLVRDRYYDGLTWHRIVPNFIVQGGSPGADEYVGDGPFMRDELSVREHTRGTVGISTRGRDTGDAQWFINLVDNPRLDHDYTIVGEVTSGMDVVDAIVEGDTMARVSWLPPAAPQGTTIRRDTRPSAARAVLQSGVHVWRARPLPFWLFPR